MPTNMPVSRLDEEDQVYRTQEEKYRAVINEIKKSNEKASQYWSEQHRSINQKKSQNCLKKRISNIMYLMPDIMKGSRDNFACWYAKSCDYSYKCSRSGYRYTAGR